jgi:predicted PurR-regulated permease PerM
MAARSPSPQPTEPAHPQASAPAGGYLIEPADPIVDQHALEATQADRDVPRWLARGAGWSWRLLLIAAVVVGILYIVAHLLVVIVPIVGGLFGAAILTPAAQWLRRRGLPPLLATWIPFLFALAAGIALAVWLIPTLGSEFGDLRGTLIHALGSLRTWLISGPLHLKPSDVDSLVHRIQSQASQGSGVLLHGALAGAVLVLEAAAAILLTLVLTFFFVKDGPSLARWLGTFAEPSRRTRMEQSAALAWQIFTAYVQGTAINGTINGLLMTSGLLIIGVPLALPIGVITFFGGFFPLVGGIVSGAIAVMVALVAKGFGGALLVLGLTILIHHMEGYVVGPLVLGRKVRLHAVVIILALSVGTVVGGVFGAFVAVPVTAIGLALIEFYRGLPVAIVSSPEEGRSLPLSRLAVVQRMSGRHRRGGDADAREDATPPVPEEQVEEPGPQPVERSDERVSARQRE